MGSLDGIPRSSPLTLRGCPFHTTLPAPLHPARPRYRRESDRRVRHLLKSFLMSIKADRWIRRMAREHGMIEPFEDRQVRKGVISYGVSSYGYDMRVAREFRIFTNVLNSIVDPKAFDPKSFVEFEGDVCIRSEERRVGKERQCRRWHDSR